MKPKLASSGKMRRQHPLDTQTLTLRAGSKRGRTPPERVWQVLRNSSAATLGQQPTHGVMLPWSGLSRASGLPVSSLRADCNAQAASSIATLSGPNDVAPRHFTVVSYRLPSSACQHEPHCPLRITRRIRPSSRRKCPTENSNLAARAAWADIATTSPALISQAT